ncbi:MAG: nucleotide exchange factor GrpE [Treponema sp.]|jgi:molecular chaperone GrpE|nr:nucleotide exchange factor GrpE [Treponema sp.]
MSTENCAHYHEEDPHPEQAAETSKAAPDPRTPEPGPAQDEPGAVVEAEAENPRPEEKLKDVEAQIAELKDQYLRKAAEFENFRKRINREKQDAIDFANQSLLLDLIPIIDDFERAIKAADVSQKGAADFTAFYEGISMIEKRLSSQLEHKWGLKRYDSAGEPFDPNRHEGIMVEKSSDIDEPVVKEDFIKGYTLKDRVVRSAKVKVLMPEHPGPDREMEKADPQGEVGGEGNPS